MTPSRVGGGGGGLSAAREAQRGAEKGLLSPLGGPRGCSAGPVEHLRSIIGTGLKIHSPSFTPPPLVPAHNHPPISPISAIDRDHSFSIRGGDVHVCVKQWTVEIKYIIFWNIGLLPVLGLLV